MFSFYLGDMGPVNPLMGSDGELLLGGTDPQYYTGEVVHTLIILVLDM